MKTQINLILALLISTISFSQPEIHWQKSLGGSDSDTGRSIQQTTDGGYIVLGSSQSDDGDVSSNQGSNDYWVVKLDASGTIEWQKPLGGYYSDDAYAIRQTADGGYVVAGKSNSNNGDVSGNHGYADGWIVKLTNLGSIEWQKTLGGSESDKAYSIRQTLDGGYIVAGGSSSNDGDVTGHQGQPGYSDFWIVKLTNLGSIEWQKSLGGSAWDRANSIKQTLDGDYIVAGRAASTDGDLEGTQGGSKGWVVKLSTAGDIIWNNPIAECDEIESIQLTLNGGYIGVGDKAFSASDYDFFVVQLAESGSTEWQRYLGGSEQENGRSIQQTSDGGYIVAGLSESDDGDVTGNHGGYDYWVVKLGDELNVDDNFNNTTFLYPNPTNGLVTIEAEQLLEINIYDSLGKLSFSKKNESENKTTIDVSHLAKGVYIVVILSQTGKEVKKLIVN